MTKRIFRSICLAAIGVFLASVALFLWVLYDYFGSVQMGQLRTETELAAHGVEYAGATFFPGLGARDYRVTWIGTDGQVLYDSQTSSDEMENHLEREEIREALETGSGESARYSATLMERTLYCARRLTDGTVIRLSVAQDTMLTLLLGMSQPLLIIAVIAVILSALLAYRLARHITAPLNRLNLDEPLKNGEYDELSPLLHRLDAQQRQIRRQQEELAERFESVTEKERAAQMRREFTANVSHELKTPLHTIAGCAELLENGMVKEEDKGRFYTQIHNEAQRMIRLVEDIIHLSHLDEGAADMRREDVDLYALAEEAVKSLAGAAEAAGVAVTLEGGPAVLNGVPQLLESIVHNLCDNSIKYNRRGGTVTVRVEDGGEAARLTVADTGIGIPAEAQERIFERFYRVDKSRSKELGGTGLGLSIVKHAARLHGAEIELRSEENVGTIITVVFPKDGGEQISQTQ